jgi:hypothetical protein
MTTRWSPKYMPSARRCSTNAVAIWMHIEGARENGKPHRAAASSRRR